MLPEKFIKRISLIVPENKMEGVERLFWPSEFKSFRINTIKTGISQMAGRLIEHSIYFERNKECEEGVFLRADQSRLDIINSWVKEGLLYPQGASSMFVTCVVDPKKGENILDMCAAPGSKTSHMAMRMDNHGSITALELSRTRMYKLKSVLNILGVENVSVKHSDARKFNPTGLIFDKILVDAPCSSEGRFRLNDKKSYAFWSERKIKEMKKKQKGLLLSACRLIAPKGAVIYSTCTFAPEENEEVVHWALKKMNGALKLVAIETGQLETYPAVKSWRERPYAQEIDKCVRVMPNTYYDGFFIAKLAKE